MYNTGTAYFQVSDGILVVSGICVFSTASALFLFPSMYPYYLKALEVYRFERDDGIGKAYDLVIQGFVRYSFLAVFPVIIAVTVIYILVSNNTHVHIIILHSSSLSLSPLPFLSLHLCFL